LAIVEYGRTKKRVNRVSRGSDMGKNVKTDVEIDVKWEIKWSN
jgi:hypothetical protein